jgi:hypothetical protein
MKGRVPPWLLLASSVPLLAGLPSLVSGSPGAASGGAPDAAAAFDGLFEPVEKAMGIDIESTKLKLDLMTGRVSIATATITHPTQGAVARATCLAFPFGAIAGTSDPAKARADIDELALGVDFEKDRFWKVSPAGGGPIPGAPALVLGRLGVASGTARLADGEGSTVTLDGFSAEVRKLDVPGETWSKGEVPEARWVEGTLAGGLLALAGFPFAVHVGKARFHFVSKTFHLTRLEGELEGGGKVSISGTVDMSGGRPSGYDLAVELEGAHIDRPDLEASATGKLALSGKPGKLKLSGRLTLDDVVRLEDAKWSLDACPAAMKLSIVLEPGSGAKAGGAKLKGTACKGKLVVK